MFNIYLDVIMIGLSLCALIAAIFGMNVPNQLESTNYAFPIIVTIVILITIISIILTKFIQKMILK